jgi:hypothetical protein
MSWNQNKALCFQHLFWFHDITTTVYCFQHLFCFHDITTTVYCFQFVMSWKQNKALKTIDCCCNVMKPKQSVENNRLLLSLQQQSIVFNVFVLVSWHYNNSLLFSTFLFWFHDITTTVYCFQHLFWFHDITTTVYCWKQ